MPSTRRVGLLVNPNNPNTATLSAAIEAAANALDVDILLARASNDSELVEAFEFLRRMRVGALAIGNDPFFNSRSSRLAELTLRHALPAIYQYREFVEAGGLMSYGVAIRIRTANLDTMWAVFLPGHGQATSQSNNRQSSIC
jgi:putative ABC transport system substrate-binding protein